MARGLMPQGPAAGAPPPQGGAMAGPGGSPPGQGQNGQGRRATDEEKTIYREFLGNVVNVLYQDETADSVVQILRSSAEQAQGMSSPMEPLAMIIAGAVGRVAYGALEQDVPVTREMAAAVAASMAADFGRNMAESAGVPPLSDEQVQALYLRTMELLREQYDVARADNGAAPPPGPGGPGGEAGPGGPPAPAGNGLMAPRPQQQQPPPMPNRRQRRAAAAERRRMQ